MRKKVIKPKEYQGTTSLLTPGCPQCGLISRHQPGCPRFGETPESRPNLFLPESQNYLKDK